MALKHNKKKNSLIIYEQLLTLASRLGSLKKQTEFDFVVGFLKNKFSSKSNLGKEKKILQNLTESHGLSLEQANELINECIEESKFINFEELEKEKVKLINEINLNFGADLFKIPVKNYKLYASAQILINENKNGFLFSSPQERTKIKNLLKENFVKNIEKEEFVEVDNVTYNILINKFNKKYGSFINEDQKAILSNWIKFLVTEDSNIINSVLKEKIEKLKKVINENLNKKSSKTTEYYELLKEAQIALSRSEIKAEESFVYEIMRYCDLADELNSKD